MKDWIQTTATGRNVLVAFIAANVVYAWMLLMSIPHVMSFAGGMQLPDMMPTGYDAAYINQLMHSLGEEGQAAYLYGQLPVDMIYPFLFAMSYGLLAVYLLIQIGKWKSVWRWIGMLPVVGGLFDYAENFSILMILTSYPNNTDDMAQTASLFTVLKSIFSTIYFLILISLLIAWAWKRLLHRNKGPEL